MVVCFQTCRATLTAGSGQTSASWSVARYCCLARDWTLLLVGWVMTCSCACRLTLQPVKSIALKRSKGPQESKETWPARPGHQGIMTHFQLSFKHKQTATNPNIWGTSYWKVETPVFCLRCRECTFCLSLCVHAFVGVCIRNRLFPSYLAFHMKMSFYSLANKTHFHIKGFALDLALKQRLKATRKWPMVFTFVVWIFHCYLSGSGYTSLR